MEHFWVTILVYIGVKGTKSCVNIGEREFRFGRVSTAGVKFTGGIQFDFNLGDVRFLAPGERCLVVSNRDGSHIELHDIASSPYERDDLKVSKPQVVAALQKQLEEWKATLPEKPTGDVFSNERKTLSQ